MSGLDQIPGTNLYIGGLFSLRRKQAMQDANITHVLSVLGLDIDKKLLEDYKHLQIEVDDVEDENLLQHFKATNAFIEEGLSAGGGVYVHCAMGKSRSATCCVAYLMKKFGIAPATALARIREARSLVEPNAGFAQQLELYHRMKMTDDVDSSPVYQRWLYQRAVQESSACGEAPDASKVRFEDEHAQPPAAAAAAPELEYRCRRCRRILAKSAFVIAHAPPPHNSPFPQALTCAHVFVDPLSWMRPQLGLGRLDGRLECPGPASGGASPCGSGSGSGGAGATVVGRYAWQGMRCSCGAWVAPAMSLTRAKVDEVRVGAGAAALGIRRGPGVGMPATRADGRGLL